MPIAYQTSSLQMEWCLECHRAPERFVRPKEEVFNMAWSHPENKSADDLQRGREYVAKYKIQGKEILTSCSTCHR
jgi:hypothetical protein